MADFLFEKDKIFAYINLNNEELKLYEKYFDMLAPSVPAPDLVIYLQATPEVLKQARFKKRRSARDGNLAGIHLGRCPTPTNIFLPLFRLESSRRGYLRNRFRRSATQTFRNCCAGFASLSRERSTFFPLGQS